MRLMTALPMASTGRIGSVAGSLSGQVPGAAASMVDAGFTVEAASTVDVAGIMGKDLPGAADSAAALMDAVPLAAMHAAALAAGRQADSTAVAAAFTAVEAAVDSIVAVEVAGSTAVVVADPMEAAIGNH
jgi:hypothetical protein